MVENRSSPNRVCGPARVRIGVMVALIVVAWSAGVVAQSPAAAAPPAPAGYEQLLAKAREAGRNANALAGPRLPPSATKAESDRAVSKDWSKWLDERSKRISLAKQAYGATARVATELQKALLRREISEVLLAFFDEAFASVHSLSAPALKDAIGRETLRRQVLANFLPILEQAHDDLSVCVRVAGAAGGDPAESRRCAALLAKVDGLFAEADAAVAADEWRYLRVAKGDHPPPQPQRTKDCVLGGNLQLPFAMVYPTADASQPSFDFSDIDVSGLAPGASRTGRLPVRVDWPLVTAGWIDPALLPLSLRKRVEVVKGKLWLGEGARVSAYGARNGRATVVRPGAPSGAPRPEPDGAEIEVACDAIGLPVYKASATPETGKPGALSGTFQLYDRPNGKRIATLHVADRVPDFGPFIVRVLGAKAGFTRVMKMNTQNDLSATPYLPFDFDAWVKGPVPAEEPWGMLVGRDEPAPPTHRAAAEASLRGEANAAAPVVARIARGATFVAGRSSNGFVAVKLPGIGERDLWLAQAELATAATALPRSAGAPPPKSARERRQRLKDIPVSTVPGVQ